MRQSNPRIAGENMVSRTNYIEEGDISEFELKSKPTDPKSKWIQRIIRSISMYYKRCPYFDMKTGICFIAYDREDNKCPRDGKYEGCKILEEFLSKKYDEIKASGKPLPYDFRDLALV